MRTSETEGFGREPVRRMAEQILSRGSLVEDMENRLGSRRGDRRYRSVIDYTSLVQKKLRGLKSTFCTDSELARGKEIVSAFSSPDEDLMRDTLSAIDGLLINDSVEALGPLILEKRNGVSDLNFLVLHPALGGLLGASNKDEIREALYGYSGGTINGLAYSLDAVACGLRDEADTLDEDGRRHMDGYSKVAVLLSPLSLVHEALLIEL